LVVVVSVPYSFIKQKPTAVEVILDYILSEVTSHISDWSVDY
jgi:hypothetical protein